MECGIIVKKTDKQKLAQYTICPEVKRKISPDFSIIVYFWVILSMGIGKKQRFVEMMTLEERK